jgi:hypothetical protein
MYNRLPDYSPLTTYLMAIGRPRVTTFTKFLLLFIIVFPSAVVLSTYIKEGEVSTGAVWRNVKSMFSKKEQTANFPTTTPPPTTAETPTSSNSPTPTTTTSTPVATDARVLRLEDDLKEKDARLETLYREIDMLRKTNKTKTDSIQALTIQLQTIVNALQKK